MPPRVSSADPTFGTVADIVVHVAWQLRDSPQRDAAFNKLAEDIVEPGKMLWPALRDRALDLSRLGLPGDTAGLVPWVALFRDCDHWHEPVCTGNFEAEDGRALEAADRRLRETGRLNSDATDGSVVTRRSSASVLANAAASGDTPAASDWPNSYLHSITVMPPGLAAHGPDYGTNPADVARRVAIRLHRIDITKPALVKRPSFSERAVRIGLAPLLTRLEEHDAPIQHQREGRSWYHIEPKVSDGAIKAAIRAAADEKVEILLMPECSVAMTQLGLIQNTLADVSERSPIELSVVGVATTPHGGGRARNQAVVFDRYGQEVARNDKLLRWNITERDWTNLGFPGPQSADTLALYENIDPGETVTLFDSPTLGRFATLICADLIALDPAAWIRRYMCLDWTFVALLDSSMIDVRWSSKEAVRAGTESHGRVVVGNSLALQRRYLARNPNAGADCGVLLTVDGGLASATAQIRTTPCDTPAETVILHDWPGQTA